jgi:hypothetical protein
MSYERLYGHKLKVQQSIIEEQAQQIAELKRLLREKHTE